MSAENLSPAQAGLTCEGLQSQTHSQEIQVNGTSALAHADL